MATVRVHLPEALKALVDAEVAEGGHGTAGEYVRDLIRQARRRKLQERLEGLLLAGLESGEASQVTADDWADIRAQVWQRMAGRRQQRDALAAEGYRLLSGDTAEFAAEALPVAMETWPEWEQECERPER